MTSRKKITPSQLLDKVTATVIKRLSTENKELVRSFTALFYSQTSYQDLIKKDLNQLVGLVEAQFNLMKSKSPERININIYNPTIKSNNWVSTHTLIQAAVHDMPFLVDSLCNELNRLGVRNHFMVFMGGMRVIRDSKGQMIKVEPYASPSTEGVIEAPLLVEIDRQTNPKLMNEIKSNLMRVFEDVSLCTSDWPLMQAKMDKSIEQLSAQDKAFPTNEIKESVAFLKWIKNNNFVFLGVRDYKLSGTEQKKTLRLVTGSSLGVLRNDSKSKMYRHIADLPELAQDQMLLQKVPLILCKSRTCSTVHRSEYTDIIDVLFFSEDGRLVGMRRFIGLYTSSAYSSDPATIPIVRLKVSQVLSRSELPIRSHAAKDLLHILNTFPRDDLFQASSDELYDLCMDILHLQERRQTRLFVRKDVFNRYVSCFIYLPKENFNTELIAKIKEILINSFDGIEASFNTYFSPSILARISYVIRLKPDFQDNQNLEEIELKIIEASRSWQEDLNDSLCELYGEEQGAIHVNRYTNVFPAGYREIFEPDIAVSDIQQIEKLKDSDQLGMCFFKPAGNDSSTIRFKLFHYDELIPLSYVFPILKNMGLNVFQESPYELTFAEERKLWINDFHMAHDRAIPFKVEDIREYFQENFNQVWLKQVDNDSFNRMVLQVGLNSAEINILRAYSKYFQQLEFTYSHQYVAESLVNNPKITRLLMDLFYARFDPAYPNELPTSAHIKEKIFTLLDEVSSLDEDKIVRFYCCVISATLRTNYFQTNSSGNKKSYLSFKIDPSSIPEMPLPLPKYEIFIYSSSFEGVHLRADKIARGGIRWSDRREDFRTEVLGLMKAQKVKNSLIVPSGAKGGFVLKKVAQDISRDDLQKEGVRCYELFVQGLLDVTDNYKDKKVIPHPNTLCYDDSDPYIVVAADKGTASFSDYANAISIERGYWLNDAFASGGSTGYDHKKMAITARGAWVSAECQFQELGIDINSTPVTVAAIGDMSGDVCGNGLLLSPHLKLVAAFNHKDIFLDPNPDPSESFTERQRLFNLPRSSWQDYNSALISKGGGVFSRHAKSIPLSFQIKKLLSLEQDSIAPNDLIKSILKSSAQLLWNGGIGTFVKSSTETNDQVGDRINDVLRINADELNCQVVAEGGNLGLTQLARIEFALTGGFINTDFIDNSAGVDCSDHEVNIKILLDRAS